MHSDRQNKPNNHNKRKKRGKKTGWAKKLEKVEVGGSGGIGLAEESTGLGLLEEKRMMSRKKLRVEESWEVGKATVVSCSGGVGVLVLVKPL